MAFYSHVALRVISSRLHACYVIRVICMEVSSRILRLLIFRIMKAFSGMTRHVGDTGSLLIMFSANH